MSLRRRRGLGDLVAVNLMSTPFIQEPEEAIETYALDPAGLVVSESEALVLELVKEASAEDEAAEVVEAVDAAAEAAAPAANNPSSTSTSSSNGLFALQPAPAAPAPLPGSALPNLNGGNGKAVTEIKGEAAAGVPWWGWALGGVAALALVVAVAKNKKKKRN